MFTLQYLYWLASAILLIVSVMSLRDQDSPRRFTAAFFWGLYGLIFLVGDWCYPLVSQFLGEAVNSKRTVHIAMGIMIVAMGLLAGIRGIRLGNYQALAAEQRRASATRLGNKLFVPALVIPLVTILGVCLFNNTSLQKWVFGAPNTTLTTLLSMAIGCVLGWIIACKFTHEKPLRSLQEARRLLDSIGCVFILPQILATLGLLFTVAGVGKGISFLTHEYLAVDHRFIAVAVYALGMAGLTMIMGNAFAAFPIVTAGVGMPILLLQHGGNPAVMAAIGMFSGYCGTLMTPMAANFNIVPAALLELPDSYGVIKAQIPTGLLLLTVNIFLLYFLMFL